MVEILRQDKSSLCVVFKGWDKPTIQQVIVECGGINPRSFVAALRMVTVFVPDTTNPDDVLKKFQSNDYVESASFTMKGKRASITYYNGSNDTYIDSMWHLKRMNAFHAWKYTTGNPDVILQVHDSGMIDTNDLVGVPIAGLYRNVFMNTDDYHDIDIPPSSFSHGTNCVSLIAANRNNDIGVSGIAPECSMMITTDVDIQNQEGDPSLASVAAGIVWGVDHGARVISLSVAWAIPPVTVPPYTYNDADVGVGAQALQNALWYAWDNDVLCIIAAGNNSGYHLKLDGTFDGSFTTGTIIPGQMDKAITIGAHDINDAQSIWNLQGSGSCYGPRINFVAPGTGTWMCDPNETSINHCGAYNGTSYATPLAAGAFGLALSENPNLSAQELLDIMYATVDVSSDANFTTKFPNAGIVNAAKAVLKAKTTVVANAGVIYPYVMFRGAGATVTITDGVANTTLSGDVIVDLRGYSSDTITNVELWIGTTLVYSGLGGIVLAGSASSSGTPQLITVTASTSTGYASEEYSDIVVSSLSLTDSLTCDKLRSSSVIDNITLIDVTNSFILADVLSASFFDNIDMTQGSNIRHTNGSLGGIIKHTNGLSGGTVKRYAGTVWQ